MVARKPKKSEQIGELIREFRVSGNQDDAFDNLAAQRLGVNETDLHCLNIIENAGGVTAGELANQSGLTTGAVTGVIDRLERKGFARRVPDPADRRRVKVEVTKAFYSRAEAIWGPVAAEWASSLARFSGEQLDSFNQILRTTNEITRNQLDRLRGMD
jgi:DNA-binding MarR family transcriptional regulator